MTSEAEILESEQWMGGKVHPQAWKKQMDANVEVRKINY